MGQLPVMTSILSSFQDSGLNEREYLGKTDMTASCACIVEEHNVSPFFMAISIISFTYFEHGQWCLEE